MDREEAIRRIKAWNLDSDDMEVLAVVIPELAESEDEKTRKELLEEIESIIPHEDETDSEGLILPSYHTRIDRYKSYLEKQKEYELTEEDKKIIPEALVMLCDDIINHRVHTPIKTDEEGARKIKAFLKTFNRQPHKTMKEWEKQKEQKPAEKQDYSGLNDLERAIHRGFLCAGVENVPVTIIKETAKECLEQMKPAEWSEEDEKNLNDIIHFFESLCSCLATEERHAENRKWLKFLKSLRPSWKPSKEQPKMNIPSAGSGAMGTTPPKFKLDVKQDLPADLEKEIEKYCRIYYNCNYPDQIQNGRCSPVMPHIVEAARHFYRLGLKARKALPERFNLQPKQNDMITPNKEFFQWIYDRLVNVHNEDPNVDYMISFKERIEESSFNEHSWKPSKEQVEAIKHAYNSFPNDCPTKSNLKLLYFDLKKLI